MTGDMSAAYAALRARSGVVAAALAGAAVAWWVTSVEMRGMDAGPGTDPGSFHWFIWVWAVMMAAMMLPSLTPALALQARGRRPAGGIAFAAGYLLLWTAAGAGAFGIYEIGKSLLGTQLAWHDAGRAVAAAIVLAASAYELTPAKRAFLAACRRAPTGDRRSFVAGLRHGGSCLGCCAGLMAALFALGVMSVTWMIAIAALIAIQKLLPNGGVAVRGTAVLLAVLAVAIAADPHGVPGLVVPAGAHMPHAAGAMSMNP